MAHIEVREGALYDVCKEQDISRAELSRRMGVDTGTAYRVEAGKVLPSAKFIAALLIASGKPFEDLFEVAGKVA